jgi:hypothetical protein
MITGRHGQTVNDLDRVGMELLPGVSYSVSQGQEQMLEPRQAAVHTTTAQQRGDIGRHAQQGTRRFNVPAQEPHGHPACRAAFGIAHLVLRVFSMAYGVQDLGTQAIQSSALLIQGGLVFQGRERGVASPHPGGGSPWLSIGRNLG